MKSSFDFRFFFLCQRSGQGLGASSFTYFSKTIGLIVTILGMVKVKNV